jgi:hypothetical protein
MSGRVVEMSRRCGQWLRDRPPRQILAIGWLGLMIYAYPGFMSYDSVVQLDQARSGVYGGGHPPMMSVLWAISDAAIAGPLGMLVIQSTAFLAGVYLLLRRCMTDRAAAIGATLVLWFPPVAAVMGVIWKDSQMTGLLVLGVALLLSPRRAVRVLALAVLWLATAMRYNALAVTFPLVVLLFVWDQSHRWWRRYPIALAAWAAVTVGASVVNDGLTPDHERKHLWHEGLALLDIVGTLRYAPELSDDELRVLLAETPLVVTTDIQRVARSTLPPDATAEAKRRTFGTGHYVPALWMTTHHVFAPPTEPAQRVALERAWRALVLGHPMAYLEHRWHVFVERVHLGDDDIPTAAWVGFTDAHAARSYDTGHAAAPGRLQARLRKSMHSLGTSWLFRPYVYLALSLSLVLLCVRHRVVLALVFSGLASEAALFVLAPTIDYRYSIWLVVATVLVIVMLVALRAGATRRLPQLD